MTNNKEARKIINAIFSTFSEKELHDDYARCQESAHAAVRARFGLKSPKDVEGAKDD